MLEVSFSSSFKRAFKKRVKGNVDLEALVLSLSVGLLLALPAQAESKLESRSATLPKQVVLQEDFNPPGNGTPKDTFSGGSEAK